MSTVEHSVMTPSRTAPASTSGLNRLLHAGFAVTVCAFLALYADTFVSLARTWARTGTFEYAFLIFPICAVLVWMRRPWLSRVSGSPRPRALLFAAVLLLLWLLGAVARINLAQHLAIVALCPVLIYVFYGPAVARMLAFPMGYVFFAVPYGDFMVSPLQDITAQLSVWALQLTDVPVLKTGRLILTPAAVWHVAEACSGVKFFIATTAFGVLYANLFFTSLSRRLIFVLCAMVVPVIANGLRVFFTILIGEYFGVQYASGTDHMIFGWQFFGLVLVLLFFAGWPFHEPPREPDFTAAGDRTMGVRPSASRVVMVTVAAISVFAIGQAAFWSASTFASPQTLDEIRALPHELIGGVRGGVDSVLPLPESDRATRAPTYHVFAVPAFSRIARTFVLGDSDGRA